MTFPSLLYWLIDAQTIGGLMVLAAFAVFGLGYLLMLRWVLLGDSDGSREDED